MLQKARREKRPACVREHCAAHVRPRARGGRTIISFEIANIEGTRGEVMTWAKEKSAEWDLPIIEVPNINPRLTGRAFAEPGIYLAIIMFDEMDMSQHRCVRGPGW